MTSAGMHYFEPNFVNEALVVLDRYGARAKPLAGGTRLVPALRDGNDDVIALVNLKRIRALAETSIADGRASIGALVTAAEIVDSGSLAAAVPLLAAAASSMGSRQLRAMATVGGNICSGDAASDLTVALLASDATCVLASLDRGERRLALRDALVRGGTAFEQNELLIAVEVPVVQARTAYRKMQTRRAFEMAIVAVAAALTFDGSRVSAARIALAGAGSTCLRAQLAERAALASPYDGEGRAWATRVGAVAAAKDAAPESDERASADYRRHLVEVLTARALVAALAGPA